MRKRSAYRPRAIITDVLSYVKSGLQPLKVVGDEMLKLKIKNHGAMERIRTGISTPDDLDTLLAALNMTEALARDSKLGIDWLEEIEAAQAAAANMCARGLNTKRFVFRGPELTAVNLAMEIHDLQLDNCTVAQLERGIQYTRAVVRSGGARRITADPPPDA